MNKTYNLTVSLESRTIIASAEGYGAVIDTDVLFDDSGIPYITARRIKGCLRDSAIEILDMLSLAKINDFLDLKPATNFKDSKFKYEFVNKLFGIPGMTDMSALSLSNLYIQDYQEVKEWLKYLQSDKDSRDFISKDSVISYYTDVTQQTAIDETIGIAKRNSLRTICSIKKGIEFSGVVKLSSEDKTFETLLSLAVQNLRSMGSNRTRGFGKVQCKIQGIEIGAILKTLEGLCIN